MTTRVVTRVPVALGSASADTEEGRAFLQDRLRLYAGWVFVLSGVFNVLNTMLAADIRFLWTPFSLFHLGATLTKRRPACLSDSGILALPRVEAPNLVVQLASDTGPRGSETSPSGT